MNLEGIVLNEMGLIEKDSMCFTYMWNLKNKINSNNNKSGNKFIDTESILRDTRREGHWGEKKAKRMRRAVQVGSCKVDVGM